MALGQTTDLGSYLYQQQPQQNQYLTSNPSTNPDSNTLWMDQNQRTDQYRNDWTPSNSSTNTSQPATPPQNGTFLGAISAGNVGQFMPQGYDQNKWDSGHSSPKYDVGRILSKYQPGPAGLKAAEGELNALGFRIVGDDKIVGADGYPIDVGQGFSGGMQNGTPMNWWWNPSNPGEWNAQGQANQSALAGQMQQQQNPFQQNNFLNQIWQQLQQSRQGDRFAQQNAGQQLGFNTGISPALQRAQNSRFMPSGEANSYPTPPTGNNIGFGNSNPLPINTGSYLNPQPGYSYIPHIPGTNIW